MKITACLFDLDGTLIDSLEDLATALNQLRQEFNLGPMSHDEVRQHIGDGARKLVQRTLPADDFNEQALERFLQHYRHGLLQRTRPYEGILDMLAQLQAMQIKLGVVTNKPLDMTNEILAGLNLTPYFSVVVGAREEVPKKPHPAMVEQALKALNSPAHETVMVGDHHTDLRSGAAAGTLTCFCQWGFGHTDGLNYDLHAQTSVDLRDLLIATA